ncbi:hypothetical protein TGAM01_v201321 [Trichoderma gamsii]|uniref:Uncharacterized protein n=1 Tax=Trichoderma gamsii TaxID=398673 RepID=A0A2P5A089_9HYPO|nr:hypothetical protein TGAM01_v201321 [Trichoderma gamsii]PON29955.1 hypothetical protein TGAM01_v201321 [Trichoderma gamsii]
MAQLAVLTAKIRTKPTIVEKNSKPAEPKVRLRPQMSSSLAKQIVATSKYPAPSAMALFQRSRQMPGPAMSWEILAAENKRMEGRIAAP